MILNNEKDYKSTSIIDENINFQWVEEVNQNLRFENYIIQEFNEVNI